MTENGVILACTWHSRSELSRLRQVLPRLRQAYSGIAVALPPDVEAEDALRLQEMIGSTPIITTDWSQGRHAALQKALEHPGHHIHYADMERLLHWVESWNEEWRQAISVIEQTECLILGRSERAWATHPRAIQETERSVNDIFSHLLGRPLDLGGGSRGFSRPAAMFLLAHSPPGQAAGTDAAWPVLLQRAGFRIDYLAVDGLEWEPPAYEPGGLAADEEKRRLAAEAYDRDLAHWLRHASLALEVIQAGLEATRQPIDKRADHWRELGDDPNSFSGQNHLAP